MQSRDRLITLSRVGTVSGQGRVEQLEGMDLRALQLFEKAYRAEVAGYIASEVGSLAVTYGWRVAALTGLPVVDAPCNGRAHPLGLMGSLGLHRFPDHITLTTAAGRHVELVIRSNVQTAARRIRRAVARHRAGLAVVRNPLPVAYIRRHAAVGALGYARRIGEELLRNRPSGVRPVLHALSRLMRGRVLARGFIKSAELTEKNGFSIGHIAIRSEVGRPVVLPVCNEYMMAIDGNDVIAAFPDLITLFDEETALPLNSSDAGALRRVVVFCVARQYLPLASTMNDHRLLEGVERLLKIRFQAAA